MRTPNAACIVCAKPLYRRAFELAKVRYVACLEHRNEASRSAGVTDKQAAALALGSTKGTNHRRGYKHKPESRLKASASHKAFCAANPDRVAARGEKTRGERNVRWKGGSSRLNVSVRQLGENRKWMDAVKARDGKCVRCGSADQLESHHKTGLSELIEIHGIKSREDARACPALWDLSNGETLCEPCHYAEHGRAKRETKRRRIRQAPGPSAAAVC